MPSSHRAGHMNAPPHHCQGTTLLCEFLNRFRDEIEHDQPIQGSDAVDAICELYNQAQRQRILSHQHSSTSLTRRTTRKRRTHS